MPRDRSEFRFWRWAAARLSLILPIGWLTVLWFRGCLVPLTKDEMRREQQKLGGQELPRR
jgi:hypothetical protein